MLSYQVLCESSAEKSEPTNTRRIVECGGFCCCQFFVNSPASFWSVSSVSSVTPQLEHGIFPTSARQWSKEVPNCIILAWIWFIIEYNLTSSHTQLNSIWVNIWSLIRSLYEIETDITLQLLQLEFKYSLSSHIFKPKLKFSLFAQVLSPGILA